MRNSLIIVLLFIGLSKNAIGVTKLECPSESMDTYGMITGSEVIAGEMPLIPFPIMGVSNYKCKSVEANDQGIFNNYDVQFGGFGPGFKVSFTKLTIRCNTDYPTGEYNQIGFSCALGVGCEFRFATNGENNCLITGISAGIGLEASGGTMTISPIDQ